MKKTVGLLFLSAPYCLLAVAAQDWYITVLIASYAGLSLLLIVGEK